ncbi:MAG TPA: redox-sensing transcriptional repressor Rex [Sedimentisphaerales bacterium]|nr:redox-sensing transcriptional repressor Rex [Sedimentisphaerales bacterium]
MRYHRIPDETIRRLPIYLRGLLLSAEQGRKDISSRDLAELLGVNSWQVRKDFSYFGDFGTRGVGYKVHTLTRQIKRILKLDVVHKAALVGVGNLGSAVLAYPGFRSYGFDIAAAFDNDPERVGKRVNNVRVESVSRLSSLRKRKINIAIIAVPRDAAQQTADRLVEAGVKGILNFSPCYVTVPRKVKVITIDIAMDLARLPYYMPVCAKAL